MFDRQPNQLLQDWWFYCISFLSSGAVQEFEAGSLYKRAVVTADTITLFKNPRIYGFTLTDPATGTTFDYGKYAIKFLRNHEIDPQELLDQYKRSTSSASKLIDPTEFLDIPEKFFGRCTFSDMKELRYREADEFWHDFFYKTLHGSMSDGEHTHFTRTKNGIFAPQYLRRVFQCVASVSGHIEHVVQNTGSKIAATPGHLKALADPANVEKLCEQYTKMFEAHTRQAASLAQISQDSFMTAFYLQLVVEISKWFLSFCFSSQLKKYRHWFDWIVLLLIIPMLLVSQPELILSFALFPLLEILVRYTGINKTIIVALLSLWGLIILVYQGLDESNFPKLVSGIGIGFGNLTARSATALAKSLWKFVCPRLPSLKP